MLCQRYGYSRDEALHFAGQLSAASYAGTVVGGIAADQILGHQRAFGGSMLLLILGYASLSLHSPMSLWLAVGLLVVGNALFKPSTQAVLSRLYVRNDPRFGAAQIWFHFAVNVGAVTGALLAGLISRVCGWNVLFAVASVIVAIGRIGLLGTPRRRPSSNTSAVSTNTAPSATSLSAWQRTKIIAALTFAMLLFATGYGQVDGTLLLWAHDSMDRVLLGFEVPAEWFVGLPAALVLMLTPIQLAILPQLQCRIGARRLVAWGLLATALAFAVLIPVVVRTAPRPAGMLWILCCITLLVVAELLVAPLGVTEVLRLAPSRFVAAVIGVWHVSSAVGYWLAGVIGALWVDWSPAGCLMVLVSLPLLGSVIIWDRRARPLLPQQSLALVSAPGGAFPSQIVKK
jgi:POT family proton-dependent oligopeptide transporter